MDSDNAGETIDPHLTHLSEVTFAYLLQQANAAGLEVPMVPLAMFPDPDLVNRWRLVIRDALAPLLP